MKKISEKEAAELKVKRERFAILKKKYEKNK